MSTRTKFHALKSTIKTLATEGRGLRDQARLTSHGERYALKVDANDVGEDARSHLLAYALLRGRELTKVESPSTRNVPNSSRILHLLKQYYVHIEGRDQDEFLEHAEKQLGAWIKICDRNFLHHEGEQTAREAA